MNSAKQAQPNLLLITTDQQRFDTIAAAGNPYIHTPHLDWLKDQGIFFTRAYADAPVCGPSRATIMTGRHHHHNVRTQKHTGQNPMAALPTLPSLLTRLGYQTRQIGKTHFEPFRSRYGYEHIELDHDFFRELQRHPDWGDPTGHGMGQNEMNPVISTCDERHTLTRWIVDRSVDFLETRDRNHPFFLHASFTDPHPPFAVPQNYWQLYQGKEVPEPIKGDWSKEFSYIPFGFRESTVVLNNIHRFSPEQVRDVRRAYYGLISQVDYNLGQLFARLRELDLLANTWIVFTSDHGEMLGDHHLGAKAQFLEGSAHIPLIVRPPQYWDVYHWEAELDPTGLGGTSCDALTCLADLMPTFLKLGGMEDEEVKSLNLDGQDLLGLATGSAQRDRLFGQYQHHYMLLEQNLKYHFSAMGGDEQLFDLAEDPYETNNLRPDEKYQQPLREMRGKAAEYFSALKHECAREGQMVSTIDPPENENEYQRDRTWPGFHTPFGPRSVMH